MRISDWSSDVCSSDLCGDQKLGVVETPHKGMEHMTMNAYGNEYAKSPYGFDNLFQHEFAREWFANQMTAANWDDFWLHEGIAAYMQPLYGNCIDGERAYTGMLAQTHQGISAEAPLGAGKPQVAKDEYVRQPAHGRGDKSNGAWTAQRLTTLTV